MKVSTSVGFGLSAITLFLAGSAVPSTMTAEQLQQLAEDANNDVIVILRDQLPNVPGVRGAMGPEPPPLHRRSRRFFPS